MTVHVPTVPMSEMVVPLVPLALQTPLAVKITGLPEGPPVALTVNDGNDVSLVLIGANVIVWPPLKIKNPTDLRSDAPGFAPPGLLAVTIAL